MPATHRQSPCSVCGEIVLIEPLAPRTYTVESRGYDPHYCDFATVRARLARDAPVPPTVTTPEPPPEEPYQHSPQPWAPLTVLKGWMGR